MSQPLRGSSSIPPVASLDASHKAFERAHRQAAVNRLLAYLRGMPDDLLPFEEVREKLRLSSPSYRGVQDVPLERIVGSLNRYQDFTRTFLPRWGHMRERWARVDQLDAARAMPPIELCQVGEAYFVQDGHHRVSVARQAARAAIPAHVWEYDVRVPLGTETRLEDLLVKAEYLEFLEQTHLDESYPDLSITFTTVGGYRELACHVAAYQEVLGRIDERPFSYPEAAAYWYDMIYTSFLQLICEHDMLQDFPGRTAADLLVWMLRHLETLSDACGNPASIDAVIEHMLKHHRVSRRRRWFLAVKRRLGAARPARDTGCAP